MSTEQTNPMDILASLRASNTGPTKKQGIGTVYRSVSGTITTIASGIEQLAQLGNGALAISKAEQIAEIATAEQQAIKQILGLEVDPFMASELMKELEKKFY